MHFLPTFVTLALAVVAGACSSTASSTIRVSDYATACTTDTDCALALDGDVCERCWNAAVAKSSSDTYERDRARLAESCPSAGLVGAPSCPPLRASCSAGACIAVSCAADGGSSVDAGACSR